MYSCSGTVAVCRAAHESVSAVAGIYNAFNFSGPIILGKIVSFLQSSDAYQKSRDVQTLVSTTCIDRTPALRLSLAEAQEAIIKPNGDHAVVQPPGITRPEEPNVGRAYLFAALIFVFPLVGAIALVHSNRLAIQVQIKLRAELTAAVYQKAMRLSAR